MKTERKIMSFKDLVAYQKAHILVLETYKITKGFPVEEKFGLVSQMRRSAVSITSNIAEGFGRNTAKDKIFFYTIANGSTLELQSQFLIARDLGFVSRDDVAVLEESIIEILKLLHGLSKSAQTHHS